MIDEENLSFIDAFPRDKQAQINCLIRSESTKGAFFLANSSMCRQKYHSQNIQSIDNKSTIYKSRKIPYKSIWRRFDSLAAFEKAQSYDSIY